VACRHNQKNKDNKDAARQLSGEVYRFACNQQKWGSARQRWRTISRPDGTNPSRKGHDLRPDSLVQGQLASLLVARKAINFNT
jgi:hypothetical protein